MTTDITIRISITVAAFMLGTAMVAAAAANGAPSGWFDGTPAEQEQLTGLVASAAGDQSEILADGVVTDAEYEQAARATTACLDARGIQHTEPVLKTEGNQPKWDYIIGPMKEGESAIYDECFFENQRDVEAVWSLQHAPDASEQGQMEARALACAEEHGLDVTTVEELNEAANSSDDVVGLTANRCIVLGFRGVDLFPPAE